uniref:E3 UFM1-protein ligase 1 homolog n=1 Tax=Globisporangium ultimum (strain ATCC 200006 / CBS 805.95 / DAOM BR144) TaxID=431595 RepID=K3X8N2_GLOUD
MDEIALLQQQLAAVQQQESALKLSDHNVIDLLMKLQQLNKIQVVHTLTGKQFLTPTQIEREIQDYVTLNAGRISMTELQQLINVDRSYVEKYVAQLARNKKNSSGSIYFVVNSGEEVVTNWYLDAIMEDTNTLLQESGTTTVGELAQQYGFTVEYMKEVVASRLGLILLAQERGNVLYTHSFVESQKAQIRGVFSAITRPTFVPDITRLYRFEEKVVDECLQELIQKRVLMGTLRGREYVPYVFIEAQRDSMYSFFQQNGYLDNARALQLQVARPYDFLKRRFPDAIPLKDCVVSHALHLQVEGSIEAAVNDASFVDLRTIVPSRVQSSDVAMLLSKSPSVARGSGGAYQINDVFAVSKAFLDASVEKLKQDASVKALKASSEQRNVVNSTLAKETSAAINKFDNDDDEDEDDDFGDKRGGKRGKKANKATGGGADDAGADKKSKRGKGGDKNGAEEAKSKGGKGKKGKKGKDGAAALSGPSKRSSASPTETMTIVPSHGTLFKLLVSWFPQLEDEDELLDGLANHLASQVETIYTSALSAALSSIIRGDAASLRELRKKFEDQFDDRFTLLSVFEKGFNKLTMSVDAKDKPGMEQLTVLETYLLESAGVELASLVTSFVAESNSLEMDGVPPFTPPADDAQASSASKVMASLSDENKKVLESNLPLSTANAIVRLWTFATAGRRSLGDFMLHVPVLADALSMPLRKLDRKKERQVIFGYRHIVTGELEQLGTDDIPATAARLLQLFFQQTTGFPATFPKDTLSFAPTVLNAFRASIPESPMAKLDAFAALAQQLSEQETSGFQEGNWSEVVDEIRALVLVKDIALA